MILSSPFRDVIPSEASFSGAAGPVSAFRLVPLRVPRSPRKPIPASEQGYVMLIAIFLIALLVIALAVAAPNVARSIQRDRDVETFHRGMQYRRAIQLYYRKFKAYPPNVEALLNTNDIHFLRKKYIDPMTGQNDWKPIAFGQNKTPTAMGFFGQPLAGNASTLAGVGPSGGTGACRVSQNGSHRRSFGSGSGSSGSLFGSSDTTSGQTPTTGGSGSTDNTGNSSGAGATGATGGDNSGTTASSVSAFQAGTSSTAQAPTPAPQHSAARASSAFAGQPQDNPSWSTRKRTTTTSGNSPMTRSPTCRPLAVATPASPASPPPVRPPR